MTRQEAFRRRRMVRAALLERARDLARSGEHGGAEAVIAAMRHAEAFDDARCWLDDWSFRHQLDRLCAMARQGRPQRRPAIGG